MSVRVVGDSTSYLTPAQIADYGITQVSLAVVWNDRSVPELEITDLDAFYGRAYGLTRDELRYILDPADVKGPDYPSETFRVLKEKEIRHHGESRTRRLVLAAWDRMEVGREFAAMGM